MLVWQLLKFTGLLIKNYGKFSERIIYVDLPSLDDIHQNNKEIYWFFFYFGGGVLFVM